MKNNLPLNKQIKDTILKTLHNGKESHSFPGWIIVQDKELESYFDNNLQRHIEWYIHDIENICNVCFNWTLYKWMVMIKKTI